MKDTVSVNGGSSSTESGQEPHTSTSFGRPDAPEPGFYCQGPARRLMLSTGRVLSDESADLPEPDSSEPEDGGSESTAKRGEIRGRSEASARRLRQRLHAMRRDEPGLFITLTLHETDPDPDVFKDWQEAFWKRVRRRYEGEHVSNLSAVWVIEPQEREVPHVHLIVWGIPFIPVQVLSQIWHEVTAETSDKHRKSGVDIESAVNQDGKLQSYLAGYMTKTYEAWPGVEPGDPWAKPGRLWGFLGRDHLPIAEWDDTVVKLHQKEAERLICELLDEWGVDLPDGVIPRTLMITCRGDPGERLLDLIERIPRR